MRFAIGIVAAAILVSGCGEASADATSADDVLSAGEAASATQAAASPEAAEPEPLRGPDLSGLFDADENHVLAPMTMDARMLLDYSFKRSEDGTALVSTGPRPVPTTESIVTSRIIPPEGAGGLWKVRLDFEGQWEGLQVLGLGTDTSPEAFTPRPNLTMMYFAQPVPVVAAKLAELGIEVNPDGSPKVLNRTPADLHPAGVGNRFDWHGQVSMVREVEGKTAYVFWQGFFDDGTY